MGRKAGLTLEDVVDAAQAIADDVGLDELTLAAIAQRLGIKPPSLYNHVDGLDGVRRQLALRGARRTAEVIGSVRASRSAEQALRELGYAYRRFARDHPGLYRATMETAVSLADEEVWRQLDAAIAELEALLGDLGIPPDRAVSGIRAVRSILHGFVELERHGGFGLPEDVDESFEATLDVLLTGLRDLAD